MNDRGAIGEMGRLGCIDMQVADCMHACMHALMYAGMRVCVVHMYVCMNVCMNVHTHAHMYVCMNVCMNVHTYARTQLPQAPTRRHTQSLTDLLLTGQTQLPRDAETTGCGAPL